VPKRDYKRPVRGIGMFAVVKSIAQGIWRVAFAAGAGLAVLLICLVACILTLVCAAPLQRIQTR
jgi:hypothetical protein